MKICGKAASLLQIWVVPKKHQKNNLFFLRIYSFLTMRGKKVQ